jgi:hypothetical protein
MTQIESKRVVAFPHGKATHYLCGVCAEKQRVRQAQKKTVAHG